MSKNFMESKLPPIYRRNNQDAYLDPIRQKLIYVTPEETIRQHVISFLIDELKVPKNMIRVEEPISHYVPKAKGRADIIINQYIKNAVAVIECKAPGIVLGDTAKKQMFNYVKKLNCDFCMLTDGENSICYKIENNEHIMIEKLPNYLNMLNGEYTPVPEEIQPPRLQFNELNNYYERYSDIYDYDDDSRKIAITNFYECLMYTEHKMPAKNYKIFRLIEDYGIRHLYCGTNNYGEGYDNKYRSFLIEYNGDTEFVSMTINDYNLEKTIYGNGAIICVAVEKDDEEKSKNPHHSLQLNILNNIKFINNKLEFYHHGRIGIGRIGSGKVAELRDLFVKKKYPQIIDRDRFYLGTLTHDRLWNLDDPEMMNLVENLISYALIRDEYRDYVKSHR